MAERSRASSGSPFEPMIGFSRAIRVGSRVLVSGTGPVWPDGSCDPDAETQALRCFDIAAQALADLGADLSDVVRTRMYLVDGSDWEAVGRAHAALFADVRPAATMVVVAELLDPRWRVEVEVEAELESRRVEWVLTEDVEEFLAAASGFLKAARVQNTVLLTVSETVRVRGLEMFGEDPPLFGWWCGGDEVTGVFLESPPYPLLLSHTPREALAPLVDALAGRERRLAGVNSGADDTEAFAAAWQDRTGATVVPQWRQRLFRLAGLVAPDPSPAGRAVIARAEHRELLIEWCSAFSEEIGEPARNVANLVDDRLEYGGLTLWEVDRLPVSMAGRSRQVAEMARIGPVYTPPDQRGRGFGAAVTAAVSRAALDAGADEVLLFTDLANPTSNRIYQRLGYQGVEDRVVLLFTA